MLPSIKPIVHKSSNNNTTKFKPRPEPESHQSPVTTTAHRLESTRPPSILTAEREPKTRTHNRQHNRKCQVSKLCLATPCRTTLISFPLPTPHPSLSELSKLLRCSDPPLSCPNLRKSLLHRCQRLQSGNKFDSRGMTLSYVLNTNFTSMLLEITRIVSIHSVIQTMPLTRTGTTCVSTIKAAKNYGTAAASSVAAATSGPRSHPITPEEWQLLIPPPMPGHWR